MNVLKSALKYTLALAFIMALAASCKKPKVDKDGIINEKVMEEVLYDYELAQALARESATPDSAGILEYKYTQAVFDKHGITSEQFDRSLGRYSRDHKKMLALTRAVEKRFEDELKNGKATLDAERRNQFAMQTDTVIVWENEGGVLLDANGCNQYAVHIDGSNLHDCERVSFGLKTNWIYSDGQRLATAVLSVVYDNDSIDVHTQKLRDDNHVQSVSAYLSTKRSVKDINIRVYQNAPWAKYMQKLSLHDMFLWSIKRKDQ